jgi:hypothetical protein
MLSFDESERAIAIINYDNPRRNFDIIYYNVIVQPTNMGLAGTQSNKPNINRADYLNSADFYHQGRPMPSQYYQFIPQDIQRGRPAMYDDEYVQEFERISQNINNRIEREIIVNDGTLSMLPRDEPNQRECILISGCSGSGKSTWASKYMNLYHRMNPKNRVIIISKKERDPEYEKLKFAKYLDLETLVDTDLDVDNFTDSLVVFDDIENIQPTELKTKVYALKDNMIETGRSENIYVLLCTHLSMNGKDTRRDLNESDTVVLFPSNSSHYHMERLLKVYCGFDKEMVKRILNVPSRWVAIKKHAPRYCITEHEVFLI